MDGVIPIGAAETGDTDQYRRRIPSRHIDHCRTSSFVDVVADIAGVVEQGSFVEDLDLVRDVVGLKTQNERRRPPPLPS